jgi:hypothetical protein
MSDVAHMLNEAAKSGRLDGLTLYRSGVRWQASVRRDGIEGWNVHVADTPEAAIAAALAPLSPPSNSVFD